MKLILSLFVIGIQSQNRCKDLCLLVPDLCDIDSDDLIGCDVSKHCPGLFWSNDRHLSAVLSETSITTRVSHVEASDLYMRITRALKQFPKHYVALAAEEVNNNAAVRPLGLKGFINSGSTCYLNSILQAILHTKPVRSFLGSIKSLSGSKTHSPMLEALTCVADSVWSEGTDAVDPQAVIRRLKLIDGFAPLTQNDVTEAFEHIHNTIVEELRSKVEDVSVTDKYANDFEKLFLFEGVREKKCLSCGSVVLEVEPILFLHVPILQTNPIQDIVDNIRGDGHETIEATCDRCRKSTTREIRTTYRSLPEILLIQLKRFTFANNVSVRLDNSVQFPINFDMSEFMTESDRGKETSTKYKLVGVVRQYGLLQSGHYTADFLVNGEWYNGNDQHVSKLNALNLNRSSPYVLVYERIGNSATNK